MDISRHPRNFWAVLLLLAAACASPEPEEIAAVDMEIERAILWKYRNESRFDAVEVSCHNGVAVLQGVVSTRKDALEAVDWAREAAQEWDSGAEIVSEIRVR